jgi:HSP20 family protein
MAEATSKVPVKTERSGESRRGMLSPWEPFESLRQEMDRLFDSFSRGFLRSPFERSSFDIEPFWPRTTTLSVPVVDVAETDKEFRVTAELPGLDEKDVEVTLSDDVLTIRGEKKEEKEEKEKNYYLSERRYGSFQRSFRLPTGIDQNKIEAAFQKGVLNIALPKTEEAQKKQKKISIKTK